MELGGGHRGRAAATRTGLFLCTHIRAIRGAFRCSQNAAITSYHGPRVR